MTALAYRDGPVALRGVLFEAGGSGIVLFPDARGIGRHAQDCAARLAALGYRTLVADLYGDGREARDMAEAMSLMRALRSDVEGWRTRARGAVAALDGCRVAIGYCFGGSTALELARSGAALDAVVSFHGGLASPRPQDAANIRAKVLVCHGADDPLVPPAEVADFEARMRRTAVDWQLHSYGGAVHGFTNPEADAAVTPALGYHAAADRRSWQALLGLLREVSAAPA